MSLRIYRASQREPDVILPMEGYQYEERFWIEEGVMAIVKNEYTTTYTHTDCINHLKVVGNCWAITTPSRSRIARDFVNEYIVEKILLGDE